ncbi:hypothetical protein DVH24_016591 [Malus domestica]|uniref:Uncharacterized protein n=1 Tax=Malus domestica TaxID=3750 RepID=A0A498HSK9_MALDO|nr:hypothetical protein DVH24_016591 [Malus domestica]
MQYVEVGHLHLFCHIPAGVDHFPGPFHHRSTILSILGLPFPHGFVFGNSRATSQWVTHHGSAPASFSLNFRVPTEPEASELPKGFVLVSFVTSRPGVDHFSGPLHHRSTILSALGLPFPHGFVFGNSRANSQWVTHPGSALTSFSLNFGVPTEPEASELPKNLVLGRDENIHLRITPLGDVRCHIFYLSLYTLKIELCNSKFEQFTSSESCKLILGSAFQFSTTYKCFVLDIYNMLRCLYFKNPRHGVD